MKKQSLIRNKFKKGDYIVVLECLHPVTSCAKNNYCFKQRENSDYLMPEVNLEGKFDDASSSLTFDGLANLKKWRYATLDEEKYYDKINKPFNVSDYNALFDILTLQNTDAVIPFINSVEDLMQQKYEVSNNKPSAFDKKSIDLGISRKNTRKRKKRIFVFSESKKSTRYHKHKI